MISTEVQMSEKNSLITFETKITGERKNAESKISKTAECVDHKIVYLFRKYLDNDKFYIYTYSSSQTPRNKVG